MPGPASHAARRRILTLGGALLLVLAALWLWRRHAQEVAPPPRAAAPVPVTTVRVQVQDVPIFRSGVGTVAALASVTVKARVDGQLERVGFVEGQDVKEGQLLAQLDPRTFQAQLEQAQAQRARDLAQLGNARVDLKRYTDLYAQEAATQQQLDTQKALVGQLEAAVQTDDAQIHFAQVQLGYTRIVAPMSGRVGARLVDPGNIVHAADANGLVVINQVDPVSVLFTLPEDAFQEVNRALHQSERPLQVIAYPRDGATALGSGRLTLVNNQIDAGTGTLQLKGTFANPIHALWPGQSVNVRLVLAHDPHALTVPAAAIQRSQDGEFVWSVGDDGHARSQPVRLTSIQDGIAIVAGGLQAGERVVIDGQYKLRAGVTVVEVARGARGAASAASNAANRGAGADLANAKPAGAASGASSAGTGVASPLAENNGGGTGSRP
jgi:membrane fusion protein, multidrug efflux system